MSRVYRQPAPSTTRRPPLTRPTQPRPSPPPASTRSTANRATMRGASTSTRGRTMHTERPQPQRNNDYSPYENNQSENQEQRTVHVGEGYHMFTPSTTVREQMRRQAETEQRQYEAHVERARLHGIHEVNRLGGDGISEEEARRRQFDHFRQEKVRRLEKNHQEQIQRKEQEQQDIEAKKQAARQQALENEQRNRNSFRGATGGWTDENSEADRHETMDQFQNTNSSSYINRTSKSEKLSTLRDMLPHIDDETLEYYMEIYNDNIDAVVAELAN